MEPAALRPHRKKPMMPGIPTARLATSRESATGAQRTWLDAASRTRRRISAGLQRWVGDFPIHGGSACRRRESDGMITPPKAVFFVGAQHAAPLQLPSRENGNGYYRN